MFQIFSSNPYKKEDVPPPLEFTQVGENLFAKVTGESDDKRINVTQLLAQMSPEQTVSNLPPKTLMVMVDGQSDKGMLHRITFMGVQGDEGCIMFMEKRAKAAETAAETAEVKSPVAKKANTNGTPTPSTQSSKKIKFGRNTEYLNLDTDESGNDSDGILAVSVPSPSITRRLPKRTSSLTNRIEIIVTLNPPYDHCKGDLSEQERKDCVDGVDILQKKYKTHIGTEDQKRAHHYDADVDLNYFDNLIRQTLATKKSGGRFVMCAQLIFVFLRTHNFKHKGVTVEQYKKILELLKKYEAFCEKNKKCVSPEIRLQKKKSSYKVA